MVCLTSASEAPDSTTLNLIFATCSCTFNYDYYFGKSTLITTVLNKDSGVLNNIFLYETQNKYYIYY